MLKRAAAMRRNLPEPERRLWMELRDSRFMGLKFRRQYVIGNRIVDFFCPARGLAIEIDGDTHDPERDARRDLALLRLSGFRVVRFSNHDVMSNLDGVLLSLKMALEQQPERWPNRRAHHPPTPSSEEEGE
nr:endonuclease domain-containing protein [Novosphingobium sp. B 225]